MVNIIKASRRRRLKTFLRRIKKRITHLGRARYCPICENHSSHFDASGPRSRPNVRCPFCGSVKRHRLIWLIFKYKTNLFSENPPDRFLHIAPESFFEQRFRDMLGKRYVTADLFMPKVDIKMDITDIQYPDSTWDFIYCSDVLEHVDDDRKAMSELYRVLDNEGWLIISVPITAAETFEDPDVSSPEDRLKIFGHPDHVRRYGPDFRDRLITAGFRVERIVDQDLCSAEETEFMALAARPVFLCRK